MGNNVNYIIIQNVMDNGVEIHRFLFDPYNVKDVFFKRNGSLFFSIVEDLHSGKYSELDADLFEFE